MPRSVKASSSTCGSRSIPPAAHVAALFYQYRVGELMSRLEQRCDWRAKRHQQHHRRHHHQPRSRRSRLLIRHACAGMALDPHERDHPALVYPGGRADGRPRLRVHCPQTNGSQRLDECDDERNAQHRRCAAGKTIWTYTSKWTGFDIAPRESAISALSRAILDSLLFVIIGLLSAVGTPLDLRHGRIPCHPGSLTVGTIVAFGVLSRQPVQPLQRSDECTGRICHLDRQFRTRTGVIDLPKKS